MVIAGRASSGAILDILAGDRVIGSTTTDESGAFAFVLDTPLAPGDYEISLAAKTGDVTTRSEETAVVQIPQKPDGDVLAIVTAPGQPVEVVAAGGAATGSATLTSPASEAEQAAVAATNVPAPEAVPEAAAPAETVVAAATPATSAAPEPVLPATQTPAIEPVAPRIGAVEIDGDQLIVSGTAAPQATVRIYVGDALVGDAMADAKGGFALLAQFPLATGNHIVRADAINPANGDVLARATVPFERAAGEAVAVAAAPVAEGQTGQSVLVPTADFGLGTKAPGFTAQTSVVIRKGDTLWQISRRVYGKGVRFSTIYNANTQQISNPDRIWPGQVFVMPALTDDGAPADFQGINDQKKVDVIVQ
ncbi:MAG: LysM peptidoglycan-binding domain-containing protein [Phyllobacteriaceae bacterium]|nr:LysM peptidoglycan-binding domain-containing protein [Phyllobacteriaceae bacterium]